MIRGLLARMFARQTSDVPAWMQRDLGYEAMNPTVRGHENWYVKL